MQKDYEVTVTVEVTFQGRVTAPSPEGAESVAEDFVNEVFEGLGPGPVYVVGEPQLVESEAFELSDDEPTEDE